MFETDGKYQFPEHSRHPRDIVFYYEDTLRKVEQARKNLDYLQHELVYREARLSALIADQGPQGSEKERYWSEDGKTRLSKFRYELDEYGIVKKSNLEKGV